MNPTALHLQILLKNMKDNKDLSNHKQIESLFRKLTGDHRLKCHLMFPPLEDPVDCFPFVCATNEESAKKLSEVVEENKLPILTSILPYRRLKSLYSKKDETRLTRELLYEVEKFAYGKQMNLAEWKPLEHFTYMTIGPVEID